MFKNILQSIFTKGLVAVTNFLILFISARYLGTGSRGEINILVLNIAVLQILNEVYTGYSLLYFVPKYNLLKIFTTGIFFTFMACSTGNYLFYALQKQLPGYEWLSFAISLLVILNTFNCVLILGRENIKTYNFLCVFQPLIHLLFMGVFIFALRDFTLQAYIFPMLFSFAAAFPVSLFFALKHTQRSKNLPFHARAIFSYGFMGQLGILMYVLSNRYSLYFLSSKEEAGLYGTACSLIEAVLIIANGISPVLLAKLVNSENREKNLHTTLLLAKFSFLMALAASLVLIFLPDSLFVFVLGKGFAQIKEVMLFYAPGIVAMSFAGIISNYFLAAGELKKVVLCNATGFIPVLFIAPFLVQKYGVKGAAINADIAYCIIAACVCFIFFRQYRVAFGDLFSLKKDFRNLTGLMK